MEGQQSNAGSTAAEAQVVTRTIKIISTRGEKKDIVFEGTEWKDLKALIEKQGYDLSNMKCVESINRTTLEHPAARVPDTNFNLFLMPVKTKAGGADRTALYEKIKKFIDKDGDKAKEHFNEGRNYTRKPTNELEELVEKYSPGTKKKVSKAKAKAISDVVETVRSIKESEEDSILNHLEGLSVDQKLDIIIKLLVERKSPSVSDLTKEEEKVDDSLDEEETPEEKEAREKKEKEAEEKRLKEEEDAKLDSEMQELASGFKDVRL